MLLRVCVFGLLAVGVDAGVIEFANLKNDWLARRFFGAPQLVRPLPDPQAQP